MRYSEDLVDSIKSEIELAAEGLEDLTFAARDGGSICFSFGRAAGAVFCEIEGLGAGDKKSVVWLRKSDREAILDMLAVELASRIAR